MQPTGTTYTSLISAFGKAGQVEEALRVYQVGHLVWGLHVALLAMHCSLAAARPAWTHMAPLLTHAPWQDMAARGCERNVITYSSLISACERAGRCDIALRVRCAVLDGRAAQGSSMR